MNHQAVKNRIRGCAVSDPWLCVWIQIACVMHATRAVNDLYESLDEIGYFQHLGAVHARIAHVRQWFTGNSQLNPSKWTTEHPYSAAGVLESAATIAANQAGSMAGYGVLEPDAKVARVSSRTMRYTSSFTSSNDAVHRFERRVAAQRGWVTRVRNRQSMFYAHVWREFEPARPTPADVAEAPTWVLPFWDQVLEHEPARRDIRACVRRASEAGLRWTSPVERAVAERFGDEVINMCRTAREAQRIDDDKHKPPAPTVGGEHG